MGVPTLGCTCPVCTSADPHDQRTRPSLLVEYDGRVVVIDTSPDFRAQALRARLARVDAVLLTHGHADHILGLDDLRPYNLRQGEIPVHASRATLDLVRRTFAYVFNGGTPHSTIPELVLREVTGPFELFGRSVIPVPVWHGSLEVNGFRVGGLAYVPDFSEIPPASAELLQNLELLVLGALRHRPHPNHSTLAQSVSWADRLRPRQTYFTHIAHDLGHQETNASLPTGMGLAYDGLVVELGG
jgi:phosphoribosyl 1,2-cyclic phosphate phosphodiesterase